MGKLHPSVSGSETLEKLIKRHDSISLRRLSSPRREALIVTHNYEPVEGQVLELEHIEYVGLVVVQ